MIGGFFFVVPIVLIFFILNKALIFFRELVAPITDLIPIDIVGGIAISRTIALVALLLVCFMAGLFTKTTKASQFMKWIEDKILSKIPGYILLKGMTESAAGLDSDKLKEVVLVNIEEVWQIGFLMDKIDEELSAVFIPGAPNAMSGDVVFVKKERLRILDLPEISVLRIYKRLGLDARAVLKGVIHKSSF